MNWRNKLNRIRSLVHGKAIVLMYHRVADLTSDPWQLSVSPDNFETHLRQLQKNYRVISVRELIADLGKKSIPSGTVCVTFDDGYDDNFLVAKPLLEKYRCPATFFVTTNYIHDQRAFWWDELEHIILRSEQIPLVLSISLGGESFVYKLENEQELNSDLDERHRKWIWKDPPPTKRCELYIELWKRMKCLEYREQQSVLVRLRNWATMCGKNDCCQPLSKAHLKELSLHPLFDIGLHTATHPSLPAHSREVQLEEIAVGEKFFNENCLDFIRVLAYPFGHFDQTSVAIVKEQKLDAAFTTREIHVTKFSDRFQLGRFSVNNWNAKEFSSRISNWIK